MFWLLDRTFSAIVQRGNLTVIDWRGEARTYGDGTGSPLTVRLTDRTIEHQLTINPKLMLGEGYMKGRVVVGQGTIYDVITLLLANLEGQRWPAWLTLSNSTRFLLRRARQFNPVSLAKRRVKHHYDVDPRIYQLMLDDGLNYSCAYFEHPDQTLEEAQIAKQRHLAAKLDLKDGHTVLDIGSGWGGLAIYIARHFDVRVKGVTLSEEQLKIARERAQAQGLSNRVTFELQDYRHITETFDRIVSVGMFEHVGISHFGTYVSAIRDRLKPKGVAVVHAIGRFDGAGATNPFIDKYIFPGGYFPALSEVLPVIERSSLLISDIEIWRLHYAATLRHWRQRFMDASDEASGIMGDEFCRMWEFYLAGCEAAFRHDGLMVFQIQLSRKLETLEIQRDYISDVEEKLRKADTSAAPRKSRVREQTD